MIAAPDPSNEQERLKTLYEYNILDTLPEQDFDDITRIASEICNTPISLVSIIDAHRQWFKSKHGLDVPETPREMAFCAHAILQPQQIMEVPDSSQDERFHDNPLVTGDPHVAFYAGVPLVTENGHALGTLCVLDNTPKKLSQHQLDTLKALANQVVCQLELRHKVQELHTHQQQLEMVNRELERYAQVVAHDLKSPLNTILGITNLMNILYANQLDPEGREYVQMLDFSSHRMKYMIDGILAYSKTTRSVSGEKEDIDFATLMQEINSLLAPTPGFTIDYQTDTAIIHTSRMALQQILINLCTNAIKYNDKTEGRVTVTCTDKKTHYELTVADNGPGIPAAHHEKIFNLFHTLGRKDRYEQEGTGIGLATVKKLAEQLNGHVSVNSEEGNGTCFTVVLGK